MPVLGPVISKVAISRFTRTLGTLVSSGVPILQALTIVKETAGNVIVSNAVGAVHESVKEGETITAPLEASGVFPPMVISMVDVGEQTGALPEMLMKIADNYDEEVDNAVAAMTSLLEPIMIVFLAVIVGSIVIAMFLPLIDLMKHVGDARRTAAGLTDVSRSLANSGASAIETDRWPFSYRFTKICLTKQSAMCKYIVNTLHGRIDLQLTRLWSLIGIIRPLSLDSSLTQREIEESFEDPFAVRLLPDSPRFAVQARFFNLGHVRGRNRRFQCVSDEREAGSGDSTRACSSRKNDSSISGKWIKRCRVDQMAAAVRR